MLSASPNTVQKSVAVPSPKDLRDSGGEKNEKNALLKLHPAVLNTL